MSTTTRRVRRWRNIRSQRRNGPILKAAHEAPWRRATLISRKHGADESVCLGLSRQPHQLQYELRYLDSASAGEHRFRSRKIVLDKKNEKREKKGSP
ncbi:hypothetical protein HZH66_006758 [Vespula vulgaris]|uniref:Uncharacterized protein n=1 Tax=Vespula vulgaris TaxID=7454 RepID=A0A834K454_VESVU|nr:hypothetical protein HZH66_006758 [Vespula vulgaris]